MKLCETVGTHRQTPERGLGRSRDRRCEVTSGRARRDRGGRLRRTWSSAATLLVAFAVLLGCGADGRRELAATPITLGDLQAVHAPVSAGALDVRGQRRVAAGDSVETGDHGRARLRLDDGTIVAVDGATRVSLLERGGLELKGGRVFVEAGAHAATSVSVGAWRATVSGSSVAFEVSGDAQRMTVSNGEVVLLHDSGQSRVSSGETAVSMGDGVTVAPEKAFVDWTGGLAVPWTSELGSNSAVGVASGVDENAAAGAPGTAMVVRSVDLDVELDGELALTRSTTRFFNGASSASRVPIRLSLPDGAILRRVARRDDARGLVESTLAIAAGPRTPHGPARAGLEWAGGGWLNGELGAVPAGATVDLIIEYVQWPPTRLGNAAYRFPMDGGNTPALIGELDAKVTALRETTQYASVSQGATLEGNVLRFRNADVRPTSDLVVEYRNSELELDVARAYVESSPGEREPYVMVRTELPERHEPSVALSVVVDASMSVGAATMEVQRAVVDAIVAGLGPEDSIVVLAADHELTALGPERPAAATVDVKAAISRALSSLRPGGATDLGAALEGAADLLSASGRERDAEGMVVYVGDGRPTLGEPDAPSIRRRLSRRAAGVPRLGAIAVGDNADRWTLGQLLAGVGTVHEVADRADAARAGAAVLLEALQPTFRDVELDLGPGIDRVYPRRAGALTAGSTVTVLGRLRGELPKHVVLRYRAGDDLVEHTRRLRRRHRPGAADIAKRWAAARIEELALSDEGIEPAISLGYQAQLLTPWTGFYFEPPVEGQGTRPFEERLLALSPRSDAAFGARLAPLLSSGSTLLEPNASLGGGVSLKDAAAMAIQRMLRGASKAVQACRDARLGVRPDVGRRFSIALSVDGEGQASRVRVDVLESAGDAVLARCVERVVRALPYFGVGVPIDVRHELTVPEGRAPFRTKCSEVSKVALPLRKIAWRARSLDAASFIDASRSCELPRFSDRRAWLSLMLEQQPDSSQRLAIAAELAAQGELDAAEFVREQTLRSVSSFSELDRLTRSLRHDEPRIDDELNAAYEQATSDRQRLGIVRRFLQLAPHDELALGRLLALLEALGERRALIDEIQRLRSETVIDAGLLARGASALRRLGLERESQRAFGELIERAPNDPWTLAFVGDRLRAEGLFDDATAVYETLERSMRDDAGVALRLALAHAGAGRLDVATRLLERVTQTGGRGDDGRLGELSAVTQALLLSSALAGTSGEVEAELQRRLLRTPLPDVRGVLVVRSAPVDDPLEISVVRDAGERVPQSPDLHAGSLGLAVIRLERGEGRARVVLRRARDRGPTQSRKVVVAALLFDVGPGLPRLLQREVEVAADGRSLEVEFDGERLL